jgi:hypothetical protein
MCEEFGVRVIVILVVTNYRCVGRRSLKTLRGLEVKAS